MDPSSDACLSLNVKDVESWQIDIGGCWVTRNQVYRDVTVGASLKDSLSFGNGMDASYFEVEVRR